MKDFEKNVKVAKFELNADGELKQNVRNDFKHDLMAAFENFLKEQGFDAQMVEKGVAVQFENTEIGSVCVVFDGTVKDSTFDIETEHQAHLEKVAEKKAKAEKLAKEKAEKIAKQNAEKELKKLKEKKAE